MLGRIMVNTSLPRHPKLFALAAEVKVNWPTALGHVVAIWCEVMAQKEGGVLEGWARGDLERVSGWKGKAGLLAEGLMKTGWIDDAGNGTYRIHDWAENQGNILEDRKYDAWRKRVERAHKKGLHLDDCPNVCRMSEGRPQDISVPFPPLPVPSSPIPSLPIHPQPSHADADAAPAAPPPLPPILAVLQGGLDRARTSQGGTGTDGMPYPDVADAPMPPGTPEGRLYRLAVKQCIQAKPETLRRYLRGWIKQKGLGEVERILMEPRIVGKGIIAIQDWYFNEMGGLGFLGEVKK